jgi:5-methylthioadenosine/S-adenosylhomocysteine deaminase
LILRPDAVVLADGSVTPGLEVCISDGRIERIRPWSSAYREEAGALLSPAFVNAHSHLEYYDLMGRFDGLPYWPWIRELTFLKPQRPLSLVQAAANEAAARNVACGVAAIGEHTDWPVSGAAMASVGLGGRLFQEVITVNEWELPTQKLEAVREKARSQGMVSGLRVHLNPHAPYTVSDDMLSELGAAGEPISIHVSETEFENQLYEAGEGPIREMYDVSGIPFEPPGLTALAHLDSLGCLHSRTQLVHACALTDEDVELVATRGATVAHCPRSNIALGSPSAPIAELRRRGVTVGLGMDSAASSGPVDMFAEMRAAMQVSDGRGDALSPEEVWLMATTDAAASIWLERDWRITEGGNPDLLLLDSQPIDRLIEKGSERSVRRLIRLGN